MLLLITFGGSEMDSCTYICELYVVKIWEGMMRNLLSCDTIPKRWEHVLFLCSFSIIHYLQYCMLEDSSTKL